MILVFNYQQIFIFVLASRLIAVVYTEESPDTIEQCIG